MAKKFPLSFYNPITLAGAALAAVSFGLILFLILLESLAQNPKPYMGIIAFVILPSVMFVGISIAVFGILREHRLRRIGKHSGPHLPQIDLNNPRHRRATVFISIGSAVLLLFSAFGSFKAYEHTDSDQFCGESCHTVMEPEFTAYQFSPHARVGCVQCHIGPGADWFVRSKISGSYQLYAVTFDKFPRPIETPIQNLRPAQETCEQCHWPKHFFSEKFDEFTYFVSDEENTRWKLDVLVKVGGGNIEAGPTSGIHWHMNIANEVRYIARDRKRQDIPWVATRDAEGKTIIYQNVDDPISEEDLSNLERRKMDCIDCHNRPSHNYHPPQRSVNHVMSQGWIDPTLPSAKSISVDVLERPYATKPAALDSIRLLITEFYDGNYPEVMTSRGETVDRMIEEVQKIYSRNYFPEMKTDWKAFNDNIGHMYYPGCFRCHDGKHQTEDGKVLSRDCNVCHTILAQELTQGDMQVALGGVNYRHPVDIGEAWKEMNCSDCHNGG